jgi:hypothetical protein
MRSGVGGIEVEGMQEKNPRLEINRIRGNNLAEADKVIVRFFFIEYFMFSCQVTSIRSL